MTDNGHMTMLEKAKNTASILGRRSRWNEDANFAEVAELAVAYIRGEITGSQVVSALDIKVGALTNALPAILRRAYAAGLLTIELKGGAK